MGRMKDIVTSHSPRLKLAVVVTHPIQYHACLWRAIAREENIDLRVLYCLEPDERGVNDVEFSRMVKWDVPLLEGYQSTFYANLGFWKKKGGFFKYFNPGLIREVCRGDYDWVYFHGYRHFTHLCALIGAKLTGKKVIFRGIGYNLGPGNRSRLRKTLLSLSYRLPDVCLYIGRLNREYYRFFGVPDDRLVHAPHVVDNDFFAARAAKLEPARDALKARFGIEPGEKVILFCGKLVERKQPRLLLEAFLRAPIGKEWVLLVVGEGKLRDQLRELAATHPEKKVVFAGFLNQSRIPEAYAVSELLVLPSAAGETWGLVVNEALNFGCAMIVSDMVGCGTDLVEGKTGEVFRHTDRDGLIEAIRRLTSDRQLLKTYQDNAKETISRWGVPEFIAGLKRALSDEKK